MAATLDKDTIVKHSFWILAGGYVLLVLACLVVLKTNVGATVQKEEEELAKAEGVVKGINDPKNQLFVDAYKKQDEIVDKKKDEVWGKAWETQKDMMTWPRDLQASFQNKYKYFGDPIDPYDRQPFADNIRDPRGRGVANCPAGPVQRGRRRPVQRGLGRGLTARTEAFPRYRPLRTTSGWLRKSSGSNAKCSASSATRINRSPALRKKVQNRLRKRTTSR